MKSILNWTGFADKQEILDYMERVNDDRDKPITFDQAADEIASDSFYWDNEWENFIDGLSEYMGKNEYWTDNAANMGWRHLTGSKVFAAADGLALIRAISPDTDCSYTFWKYRTGFKVKLSHHDAPMGETHIIKPLTEKQFNTLTNY